jgi:hypothetical protein
MRTAIPKTISVKLTEHEVHWILTELQEWILCRGGDTDPEWGKHELHLAKKLHRRLKERGFKQPDIIGRDATKKELADAKFFGWLTQLQKAGDK